MLERKYDQAVKMGIKPRLVVKLDWDNTIMASADFFREVLEKTAERVQQENGITLKSAIPPIATKPQIEILKDLFGAEHLAKVEPIFREVYKQIFKPETLKMLLGAKEFLEKLNSAGIAVAIISNYTVEGIKEHLDLRKIDYSNTVIIGVDTATHTKPHIAPGKLALERLKIDPVTETVMSLMIGDGISSDMKFAENMDAFLKSLNPNSSCMGILFNSLLNGNEIFSPEEIKKFTESKSQQGEAKDALFMRKVTYGYSRLFVEIRNRLNPAVGGVTAEMLAKQKETLKHVPQSLPKLRSKL